MYRLCVELHRTPDEIRAMSSRDFVYLIAAMTAGGQKALKWGEGGAGVVMGWVERMRKQKGGRHGGGRRTG